MQSYVFVGSWTQTKYTINQIVGMKKIVSCPAQNEEKKGLMVEQKIKEHCQEQMSTPGTKNTIQGLIENSNKLSFFLYNKGLLSRVLEANGITDTQSFISEFFVLEVKLSYNFLEQKQIQQTVRVINVFLGGNSDLLIFRFSVSDRREVWIDFILKKYPILHFLYFLFLINF